MISSLLTYIPMYCYPILILNFLNTNTNLPTTAQPLYLPLPRLFLQRPLVRLLSRLLPRQFLPLSMGPDPRTEEAPTLEPA